ncbi:MAG: hypothetical protein Q8M92_07875 [Candidatus Subteraquimicrobiales bacterium]|nr:hypothetical protein [Candidatus Subteraquimicrobiales bacterium]
MPKKIKNLPQQETIFEWVKRAEALTRQSTEPTKGSLDIDAELRAAVTEDLKHAIVSCTGRELSRYEVAARMSDLVGQEITASMLYSWTSESHEKHRFPCQFLPAFVIATGGQRRVFETLSRRSGLFALPGPEALRAEIQRLEEEIKRKKAEKHKREIFLKEIEQK